MPPAQDLPLAQYLAPQAAFGPPPGYPTAPQTAFGPPPGYPTPPQPEFGPPPGYAPGPPGYAPGTYPIQPGFGQPAFGPAPYPASGWMPPQPGPWVPAPYPPAGPGFQPWYGGFAYAPAGPGPGLLWGGVGIRFAALLIDMVLVFFVLVAAGMLMGAFGLTSASGGADSPAAAALALAAWLFIVIYHPACWYIFGATAGQRALGLRVVRLYDGQELGIGAVLVRYVIFLVVTIVFPLGLVSAYLAANDPYKRAWQDDVARSIVVRRL